MYIWVRTLNPDRVMYVNGQRVGDIPLVGSITGPIVWEFLNQMGSQGWELAGITYANPGSKADLVFIMKRPIL